MTTEGCIGEARTRYGPRARSRLRIAARLLRLRIELEPADDERFCEVVLGLIQCLTERRRRELRSLVDWVEDYEQHEAQRPRA